MTDAATTVTPEKSVTVNIARPWALRTAVVAATITAVLHTFAQATPIIDALMTHNATAESQQGLRMMWHGMSAIVWTYPVALLLLARMPAAVTRPALGYLALLNGAQAVLYLAAGLWTDGASGLKSLPQWIFHAVVAGLALSARPPRPPEFAQPPVRRHRWQRIVLWLSLIVGSLNAIVHTVLATSQGWPVALLDSDTPSPAKPSLYATWLFSCVVFIAVPATVAWSLRSDPAAARFIVRYTAALVATLAVSCSAAMVFGLGHDLTPIGPLSLTLLATLTALGTPPR